MERKHIFQKVLAIVKRLSVGYGFLLLLMFVSLTLALPFVLTIIVGLGLLPPDGFPFPRGIFKAVASLSVAITLVVGLRWLWFPSHWLDAHLAALRSHLLRSKKYLLLRFVGILVAFPLFAFILSPCAVTWLGLETGLYRLHLMSGVLEYASPAAMISGFIWLAVIVGRLCPPPGRLRRVVLRCRMIFIDWVLEPGNPPAAQREREALRQRCQG